MMKMLFWKIRYSPFFRRPDGIQRFSEKEISNLIYKLTLKNRKIKLQNTRLEEKERDIKLDNNQFSEEGDLMSTDDFLEAKKRIRQINFWTFTILATELFINYISTLIFINGHGFLYVALRWGLAISLTFLTMLVFERLLLNLWPPRGLDEKIGNPSKRTARVVVLAILGVLLEISIVAVSHARAVDIEGSVKNGGDLLSFGFIALAVVLPIIAAYLFWEKKQFTNFKRTKLFRRNERILDKIDLKKNLNDQKQKDTFKKGTIKKYKRINFFKTIKTIETENAPLNNHYSENYELFTDEVEKRLSKNIEID